MNFKIVDGSYKTDFTWELKPEWPPERMRRLALDSTRLDVERSVGLILSPKVDMQVKEVVLENGKPALNLVTEIKYKHREYTGSREGTVVVHERVISSKVMQMPTAGEALNREAELGHRFVASFLPEAVRRVGCYCCYGDGPDLECEYQHQKDGSLKMVWTVNFDFRVEDYT